jgi:hypothetical protein
MNFLLVLSALAAEATIGCATRVRVKTSGLSSQSGFKAPEVRQPQFAPALPAYFHTAARFHARLWQPAMGSSQAGRRGFESRLPLHPFNNLHELGLLQKPTFRGNGVGGRAEPIKKNRLEGLTASVPRWPSYIKGYGSSTGRASETPFADVISPTPGAASPNSTSRFRRSDPDGNCIARFELGAKPLVGRCPGLS